MDLPQGAMLLTALHVQQLRDGCVDPQVLPRVAHVRAHQQRPTLQLAADPAAVGTAAPLELVVETSAHHLVSDLVSDLEGSGRSMQSFWDSDGFRL